MVKAKEYNDLSGQVYTVGQKKKGSVVAGKSTVDNKYKVLATAHDGSSGFQSMAVVPKDDQGVDMSTITIAYAGTNPLDFMDDLTDFWTIGEENSGKNGQLSESLDFAEKIKKKYPKSKIETTGHSLGGFLAQLVAIKNHWSATTFSAPSPDKKLIGESGVIWSNSPDKKNKIVNYTHPSDLIPLTGGELLGKQMSADEKSLWNGVAGHKLETFIFDKKGNVKQFPIKQGLTESLHDLKKIKSSLSANGLSSSEKIYLDIEQAAIISVTLRNAAEKFYDSVRSRVHADIQQLEDDWTEGVGKAADVAPRLSRGEILSLLADAGVTKTSMVTTPTEKLNDRLHKAKKVANKMTKISEAVNTYATKMADSDQRVSNLFEG